MCWSSLYGVWTEFKHFHDENIRNNGRCRLSNSTMLENIMWLCLCVFDMLVDVFVRQLLGLVYVTRDLSRSGPASRMPPHCWLNSVRFTCQQSACVCVLVAVSTWITDYKLAQPCHRHDRRFRPVVPDVQTVCRSLHTMSTAGFSIQICGNYPHSRMKNAYPSPCSYLNIFESIVLSNWANVCVTVR